MTTELSTPASASGPVFENSIQAIKAYFGSEKHGGPQTIEMKEFKEMSGDERKELGLMCALALGGTVAVAK